MKHALFWRAFGAAVFYGLTLHTGHAQTFYRCLGAQGRPEFSAQPCAGGGQPTDAPAVHGPAMPGLLEQLDRHIVRRQPATPSRPPDARAVSPGAPIVEIVQPPAR